MMSSSTSSNSSNSKNYKITRRKREWGVALAAVTQYGSVLKYVPEEMQRDKDVVLVAVRQNGRALEYAYEEMKRDKEVVLVAVKKNANALQYASIEMKRDKEVVLAAVSDYGWALRYASEELKRDKEVALAAVTKYGNALDYVDDALRNDTEFMTALVNVCGGARALDFASGDVRANKHVVLAAVSDDGWALEYASEELKRDKEVVLAAVTQQEGGALLEYSPNLLEEYVDDALGNDTEFITALVNVCGGAKALDFASGDVRANRHVVMAAVSNDSAALRFVRDVGLLGNKEIILASIKSSAPASFKTTEDISLTAYYHFTRNNVDFVVTSLQKNDFVSSPRSRPQQNCGLNIRTRNAKRQKGER